MPEPVLDDPARFGAARTHNTAQKGNPRCFYLLNARTATRKLTSRHALSLEKRATTQMNGNNHTYSALSALYCDGHVKSVRLDSLVKKNAAGWMSAFTVNDD